MKDPRKVLHWYDFLCPFCYVAQQRDAILVQHELQVEELPFQAHPEIPAAGISAGLRTGPMYAMLEREAKEAGLHLRWSPPPFEHATGIGRSRVGSTARAGRFSSATQSLLRSALYCGRGSRGPAVIDRHGSDCGVDLVAWHAAFRDGSALEAVTDAESLGRNYGVQGTPAWVLDQQLILGLRPAAGFERLAGHFLESPNRMVRREV